MSIADQIIRAKNDYDEVYASGKKAEYDRFWDAYQDYGNRVQYPYAFYNWGDEEFKPKYPIIFGSNVSAQDTFSYCGMTEVPVDIIVQEGYNIHSAFYYCTQLREIKKIVITENSTIDNHCFDGCWSLNNIRFEGKIGNSINFQWSPLVKASVENIFSVLSANASGKKLTLSSGSKGEFTADEWNALVATRTNWTISIV